MVRSAFGRNIEIGDIYEHVTSPERVYLLRNEENSEISAMASYNQRVLSGLPSLIVEGIAIAPEIQGRSFFNEATETARDEEQVVCLRTQNPRMYRALEKYCSSVFPNGEETPEAVRAIRDDLARYMDCQINEDGVVRGHYGGLFYGEKPYHEKVSPLFDRLGMELNDGDALLVVGVK